MDSKKIYNTALETLNPLITPGTPAAADSLKDAISKAITAAIEEYDKQKQ